MDIAFFESLFFDLMKLLAPIVAVVFVSSLLVYFLSNLFQLKEKVWSLLIHLTSLIALFLLMGEWFSSGIIVFTKEVFVLSEQILR